MTPRSTLFTFVYAAIGFAVLAGLFGVVSVSTLQDSHREVTESAWGRERLAAQVEAAQLRTAQRQQDLLLAHSSQDLISAERAWQQARRDWQAAIEALSAAQNTSLSPRLDEYRTEVTAYLAAADRMAALATDGSKGRARAYLEQDGDRAFERYLAAVGAARDWVEAQELSNPLVVGPSIPAAPYAGFTPGPTATRPSVDAAVFHRQVSELVHAAWSLQMLTHEVVLAADTPDRARALAVQASDRIKAVKTAFARLTDALASAPKLVTPMQDTQQSWLVTTRRSIELAAQSTEAQAVALARGEVDERMAKAASALSGVIASAGATTRSARQVAEKKYRSALSTTLPALIIAIGAGFMLWMWLTQMIPMQAPASSLTSLFPDKLQDNEPQDATPDEALNATVHLARAPLQRRPLRTAKDKVLAIHEVTRQTTLLALNATAAANRVVAQGNGFAAVAAEVRRLADRSQAAAAEIIDMPNHALESASAEILEAILPDVEAAATLIIEISAASHEPAGAPPNVFVNQASTGPQEMSPSDCQHALAFQAKNLVRAVAALQGDHVERPDFLKRASPPPKSQTATPLAATPQATQPNEARPSERA